MQWRNRSVVDNFRYQPQWDTGAQMSQVEIRESSGLIEKHCTSD
jgi:hypothetical protein